MLNHSDHRLLADEMEIFFLDEEIGAGLPVWLPNGVIIRDQLELFIKDFENKNGYQRVVSPHLGRQDLYERSGHLDCFSENMFPAIRWPEEKFGYYLKPMNCPHHHKIFGSRPRSYRQLPLRLAEYGQVYRYELSGALRGLSRVRGLCQNDGHIYVDPKQALNELLEVLKLHENCYKKLGLSGYRYRLSLSDNSRPADFKGDSSVWLFAEDLLRQALKLSDLEFFESVGEAAFYGPKIDIQMAMGYGNEESISSIQLDFISAERFDLSFSSRTGSSERPWIIHRAPLGSHERFIAMLLEYYKGKLPGWLAPVQVMIFPVSSKQIDLSIDLNKKFIEHGIRSRVDDSQGHLKKRMLFAHRLRPFSKLVVGDSEAMSGRYQLQLRDKKIEGKIEDVMQMLHNQCVMPY